MKKYHKEDIIPVGTRVMVSPNITRDGNRLHAADTMLQLGRDRFISRVADVSLSNRFDTNSRHVYRISGFGFYWEREWLIPYNELTLYDLI